MLRELQAEAQFLTQNAAKIADSQKCCWQAQVTMRRWCDAALRHIYRTRFLTALGDAVPSPLQEEQFVALCGVCEPTVQREWPELAFFERQYPLESAFLIRLLVRLPEMAKHVDVALVARFVRQPLLLEHIKVFCDHVFDCWANEQPEWFVNAKKRHVAAHACCCWTLDIWQHVHRLFDIVQVERA